MLDNLGRKNKTEKNNKIAQKIKRKVNIDQFIPSWKAEFMPKANDKLAGVKIESCKITDEMYDKFNFSSWITDKDFKTDNYRYHPPDIHGVGKFDMDCFYEGKIFT